ncbi:(2Fe-2S)-binding protein [Paracoccus zhejiangensis]|uniref:Ferredoxin n=1 Tax=Paracoccus zhejiangensis TaxID=1077935 RepID=A0A2H5EZT0_9RHOB|nr:(2Fe-2S)-binding protein [Paracoccus zhejiangensis]AUH64793.1 ferredoxin [Paracoccus zhejiangensis]
MSLRFTVNGQPQEVADERGTDRLIDFLHDDLNLTGTKFGCGIGVCRACTVVMAKAPNPGGTPVVSCSTPLSLLAGAEITTIEGVTSKEGLLPIQQAFLSHFSFQCGYCAPGFVMAAQLFLEGLAARPVPPDQLDAAIARAIGDHICRCSGYVRYAQALKEVALSVLAEGSDAT